MVSTGSLVFFDADDGIHGDELWRTDGTEEGTFLVRDIMPGAQGSDIIGLRPAGKHVFFFAPVPTVTLTAQLWVSDGSAEGTQPVFSELGYLGTDRQYMNLTIISIDGVVFLQSRHTLGQWLWIVDTRRDPRLAKPFMGGADAVPGAQFGKIVPGQHGLFVKGATNVGTPGVYPDETIWYFRADEKGFLSLVLGQLFMADLLGTIGDRCIFRGKEPTLSYGIEPFVTDGTREGTFMLRDIMAGAGDSLGTEFAAAEDWLVFSARNLETGYEPWVTDGTQEGTRLLLDINPGPEDSLPGMFMRAGSRVFFQATTPEQGHELWVTEGSPESTHLVLDINPGFHSSKPFQMVAVGDLVYFTAEDAVHGGELWVSDGTPEGTHLVVDLRPGPEGAWPYHKAALRDQLVFTADDPERGDRELWITNGTAEGTRFLKDVRPMLGPNPSSNPTQLTMAGTLLFFVVNDAVHGAELWRSDGSSDGTYMLRDIYPGPPSSRPAEFLVYSELTESGEEACSLFFQAESPEFGRELWCTDGTQDGTYLFIDINVGPPSSNPQAITKLRDGLLALVASSPDQGNELIVVSTSTRNVDQRHDLRPGPESSAPADLVVHTAPDGTWTLYFTADDGVHGRELWMQTSEFSPVLVRDILTNTGDTEAPANLTPNQDGVFFSVDDPSAGAALLHSDGTAEGTQTVLDLRPAEKP